ncbi:MAG: enoyl-CoA hydratase-related protein [Candidatus Hydrogenedentes bacterium]|jgi:methylglutaconyl-CoA hydratase|nr:enoyl-CoA hydratase-related protein [Candidatus Hydrogenedentota bacterium]
MPTTEDTLYDVRNGGAWITLNRPEKRNALSPTLIAETYEHILAANEDDDVRCVVITGAPPAFCAGADLKAKRGQGGTGPNIPYPQLLTQIQDNPKPVIAAVNGAAYAGGLGMVGAVDISVAVDDVNFSFSEVRIGVIPAVISVVCLPKLGKHHGMKLFLTGEKFSAAQAVDMGFLHRAVPRNQLEAAVQEEIDMICLGGPNAVTEAKKLVRRVPLLSREDGFAETAPWSAKHFASDEGKEGMLAFREKRKPSWVKE